MPILEKPPEREFEAGTQIADQYVVVRKVGRGGQGDVFLVTEASSGLPRAFKVTRLIERSYTARFLRGAISLREIQHPHIVRVTDSGLLPDGAAYVVTEWIDGPSLRGYHKNKAPTLGELCTIGESIANALTCLHAAGRVHRDIKPDNIMLRLIDGVPDVMSIVLLDFGLSQRLRHFQPNGQATTELGWIAGTVTHMAPEQLAGRRSSSKTDLYGLGATLYELAYGRSLACDLEWGRASVEKVDFPTVYIGPLVMQRLTEEIELPINEHAPASFQAVLKRLLRRDPNERPESASVAERMLRTIRIACEGLLDAELRSAQAADY
jgi:serine/threonine protein kinase